MKEIQIINEIINFRHIQVKLKIYKSKATEIIVYSYKESKDFNIKPEKFSEKYFSLSLDNEYRFFKDELYNVTTNYYPYYISENIIDKIVNYIHENKKYIISTIEKESIYCNNDKVITNLDNIKELFKYKVDPVLENEYIEESDFDNLYLGNIEDNIIVLFCFSESTENDYSMMYLLIYDELNKKACRLLLDDVEEIKINDNLSVDKLILSINQEEKIKQLFNDNKDFIQKFIRTAKYCFISESRINNINLNSIRYMLFRQNVSYY